MAEATNQAGMEKAPDMEVKKSDLMLKITTLVVAVALLAVVALMWLNFRNDSKNIGDVALISDENGEVMGASTTDPNYLPSLAATLKTEGYILYGSSSNSDTREQKNVLGSGFSAIDYVECDTGTENSNPQECAAKGIEIYPTWVRGDKKVPGFRSLSQLEEMLEANF